jgi:cell division protein FtsB
MLTLTDIERDIKSLSAQVESNTKAIEQLIDTNSRLTATISLLKWKRSCLGLEAKC